MLKFTSAFLVTFTILITLHLNAFRRQTDEAQRMKSKNNNSRRGVRNAESNIICFFCHAYLDPTNKTQHTMDDCLTNACGMGEEQEDFMEHLDNHSRDFGSEITSHYYDYPHAPHYIDPELIDKVWRRPASKPPITKAPTLSPKNKKNKPPNTL